MAPFIGQNIGEDQKKKSSLQNDLVFSPKACDDQKKGLCLPISGFSVSKEKKTQMVSPQNGDTRPPLPSDASEKESKFVIGLSMQESELWRCFDLPNSFFVNFWILK